MNAPIGPLGPFATPQPRMRGQYLMRQPLKVAAMRLLDGILSLVPMRRPAIPVAPRRILVANWAHLGDVITTFGALAALRRRFPDARIGMIVGSWGKPAIAQAGLVDDLHVIDHWKLNRSRQSKAEKRRRYRETRATALREIAAIGYDVAIDLFAIFPPAHPLFYGAGIPVRIGYTSGGFGPLLTHPVRWIETPRPMAEHYRDLLDVLAAGDPFVGSFQPRRRRDMVRPLPAAVAELGRYIVVHPGAGSPQRIWGHPRWRALIDRFSEMFPLHGIVLTGAGNAEVTAAESLAAELPGIVNMAGSADWEDFVSILAHADLVVCPDTATGHVAALFETPTVSIFTGTNSLERWAPYSPRVRVVTQPVLCAPCNLPGCEAMACFLGVSPDDVARAAAELIPTAGR